MAVCAECGFEIQEGCRFCGNCGQKVVEAPAEPLNAVSSVLHRVVLERPEALQDKRLLDALLGDYLPEKRRERNLLLRALESGVPQQLHKCAALDGLAFGRLVRLIVDEHGVSEENAEQTVLDWAAALGVSCAAVSLSGRAAAGSAVDDGENGSGALGDYAAADRPGVGPSGVRVGGERLGSGRVRLGGRGGGRVPPWRVGLANEDGGGNGVSARKPLPLLASRPDVPVSEEQALPRGNKAADFSKAQQLAQAGKFREALPWLRSAAEQGHVEACYELAKVYYYGKGVVANSSKAMRWYRSAADGGHTEAEFIVAKALDGGLDGLHSDPRSAVMYYERAAEKGQREAQYRLGMCYCNGRGVTAFPGRGMSWLEKAAQQGLGSAQFQLAKCYAEGVTGSPDMTRALFWYRKAAEGGNRIAQYCVGQAVEKHGDGAGGAGGVGGFCGGAAGGVGGAAGEREAYSWYMKSAAQDYAPAQVAVGRCLQEGIGVEEDYEAAVDWYQKACANGDALAMYRLGRCYQNGDGVPADAGKMVRWYKQAAEQGIAEAAFDLGWCYENGYYGLEQDYAQAVSWYDLAAEKGATEGIQALRRLDQGGVLKRSGVTSRFLG